MVNRKAAQHLAAELNEVLASLEPDAAVPDSERWREALVSLEFWWPSVYGWELESLDGFDLFEATKTGPGQVRLRGLALLISDQTWTPCEGEIRVGPTGRVIESYSLRLGQPGAGALGLDRAAKYGSPAAQALRAAVSAQTPSTDWVFTASSSIAPRIA